MLGEVSNIIGDVTVDGVVSYVPQEAWILPDTVKNNVLLGRPLKFEHYQAVVESCALIKVLLSMANFLAIIISCFSVSDNSHLVTCRICHYFQMEIKQ